MATNITRPVSLRRDERQRLRGQKGFTVWFTGLSASGKSTLALALEQRLLGLGLAAYRLDGDNMRFGINRDLGFSGGERRENIRRVAEVARLFADSATVALASFISPYAVDRRMARVIHQESSGPVTIDDGPIPFVEVFVDVPLAEAERRDPKGLYRKARAGEIQGFTGISSPYEAPEDPDVHLRTDRSSVDECVTELMAWLREQDLIPPAPAEPVEPVEPGTAA